MAEFLLAHEIPDCDDTELVEGRLYLRGSVSFLHAAPGAGKTFAALDLACRRACGLPWFGSALSPGNTVYIYTESAGRLRKRLDAWEIANNQQITDRLVFRPGKFVMDETSMMVLSAECAKRDADLVIIDNLLTSNVGKDVAAQKDMSSQLDLALTLAAYMSGHVMIIHHDNRQGEFLGTMMIDAIADTRMHIRETEGVHHLVTEKNRDLPGFSVSFRLPRVEIKPGKVSCAVQEMQPMAAAVQSYEAQNSRLLAIIRDNPNASNREILAHIRLACRCDQSQASLILRSLVDSGEVTRVTGPRNSYRYQVT